MKPSCLTLTLASLFLFTFCSTKESKKAETVKQHEVSNELKEEYFGLRSKVDSIWVIMDSNNIVLKSDIERLLKEIEWTNQVPLPEINEYRAKAAKLDTFFYTQKGIPDVEQIDQDDAQVDEILNGIIEFAYNTPGRESINMISVLISDLQAYTGHESISLRGSYNTATLELNQFIRSNKEELDKIGVDTELYPSYTSPEEAM